MMLAIHGDVLRGRHHRNIPTLLNAQLSRPAMSKWLWLAFFAPFAVEDAVVAGPTCLLGAQTVEAPTAGLRSSLAAILLKMGGLRASCVSRCRLFPDASLYFQADDLRAVG